MYVKRHHLEIGGVFTLTGRQVPIFSYFFSTFLFSPIFSYFLDIFPSRSLSNKVEAPIFKAQGPKIIKFPLFSWQIQIFSALFHSAIRMSGKFSSLASLGIYYQHTPTILSVHFYVSMYDLYILCVCTCVCI